MRELPILFNTEMVGAILSGRKTQTRRVIKDAIKEKLEIGYQIGECYALDDPRSKNCEYIQSYCPFGVVGDHLWVRETFCYGKVDEWDAEHPDDQYLFIEQDDDFIKHRTPIYKQWCLKNNIDTDEVKWTPSIHMPRSACRIVLEVASIRVERLQDISESDCLREGVGSPILRDCKKPKFMQLWNSINGSDSWTVNPWVWVIEFKVIQGGAA